MFKKIFLILVGVGIIFNTSSIAGVVDKNIATCLKKDSPAAEFVPGEIVVQLNAGNNLQDLSALNNKYGVSKVDPVFPQSETPKETLAQLKTKLTRLSAEHDKWYWQLDKNSPEYKTSLLKIENEKKDVENRIVYFEALVARLEARQNRAGDKAQDNSATVNLQETYVLKADPAVNVREMVKDYSGNKSVRFAEPNYLIHLLKGGLSSANSIVQSDFASSSWAISRMRVPEAQQISKGEGALVALIDTGVDYTYPELLSRLWTDGDGHPGYDFVNSDFDPMDDHGHGTAMASLIAGPSETGVAPKAKIMDLKALDSNGAGDMVTFNKAIGYAVDKGADIINLSLDFSQFPPSNLLDSVFQNAQNQGILVIVAAGNEQQNVNFDYPANVPQVVTVSGTTRVAYKVPDSSDLSDSNLDESNFGDKIDLSAPGDYVLALYSKDHLIRYRYTKGTSASCALVSGVSALIIGKYPSYSLNDLKKVLYTATEDLGDPGWDRNYGYGIVNALKAVDNSSSNQAIAHIRSPQPFEEISKASGETSHIISIKGTVCGKDFAYYNVEVGSGKDPSTWQNTGKQIIPVEDNNAVRYEVIDRELVKWDTSQLTNGIYTFRLRAFNAQGSEISQDKVTVVINNSPLSGWPKQLYDRSQMFLSYPVMADVNKDGLDEVIAAEEGGTVHILNYQGQYVLSDIGFFVFGTPTTPAVGDIDADGVNEVVVGSNSSDTGKAKICIFKFEADQYPLFLNIAADIAQNLFHITTCVLADLDGDGKLEIITADTYTGKVYAFRSSGELLPGWPVQVAAGEIPNIPAAGDINGDGLAEVVVTTMSVTAFDDISQGKQPTDNGKTYVWKKDGSLVPGWPVNKGSLVAPAVIGDVNGDKQNEVIVNAPSGLYVFKNDGNILPGWPKIGMLTFGLLALGDVNGDNIPEIIFAGSSADDISRVYVYPGDASNIGWSYTFPKFVQAWGALVVDLTGDGLNDILVSAYNNDSGESSVYVFNNQTVNSVSPLTFSADPRMKDVAFFSLPALGKANSASFREAAYFTKYGNKLNLESWNLQRLDARTGWLMFGGNAQHTGAIQSKDAPVPIDSASSAPPVTTISGIPAGWAKGPVTISLETASGIDSYTKSILHCNGLDQTTTFADSAISPHTFTAAGTARVVSANSKFGGASGLFDGSSAYLSSADSDDWNFGSGDFSIDFWAMFNSDRNDTFFSQGSVAENSIQFRKQGSSNGHKISFLAYSGGVAKAEYQMTNPWADFATGTWYHIALVRNGSSVSIYINGVSQSLNVWTAIGVLPDLSGNIFIGARGYDFFPSTFMNGWLDEFRISKGIARRTADFIPPSQEYNQVTTYYSIDGSDPSIVYSGPFTISDEGSYTIKYRSIDKSGNTEDVKSATVHIDTTTPTGSINRRGYIYHDGITTLNVVLDATTASGKNLADVSGALMRFSINGQAWTSEPYAKAKNLDFSTFGEPITVLVEFADAATPDRWSEAYGFTITLARGWSSYPGGITIPENEFVDPPLMAPTPVDGHDPLRDMPDPNEPSAAPMPVDGHDPARDI